MKKINQTLLLSLFFFSGLLLQAQMNYWTLPDQAYNMNPNTPTSSNINGATTPFSVSNGYYKNGILQFYVHDYQIMDANSNVVGELGVWNASSCTENYSILNTEVVIVPVFDKCDEFYLFYGMDNPVGASLLLYTKVDMSSGIPVPIYSGSQFRSCSSPFPYSGTYKEGFHVTGHFASDHLGIAVSKVYGDVDQQKRDIYTVGNGRVNHSEISSSGVTTGVLVADDNQLGAGYSDFDAHEVELSWGDDLLAWTSPGPNGQVNVLEVIPGGTTNLNFQQYPLEFPKGLEFTNDINSPKLYVSHQGGIEEIFTTSQSTNAVNTNGWDLTNTYLECGKNGKIYGVGIENGGNPVNTFLVGITPSNNSLSSLYIGIDSRYILSGSYTNSIYNLPDQIDGEDYDIFNGYPKLSNLSFMIDNIFPTEFSGCSGRLGVLCADNMILNASYNGSAAYHNITAYSVNSNCFFDGNYYYSNGFSPGDIPSNFDLGSVLNITSSETIKVEVRILDECGNETFYFGYYDVVAPLPANIDLGIYNNTNSQSPYAPSTNINSPVPVGGATIGFNIDGSTGSISTLRVEVDEVNSSGGVIRNIYDKTTSVSGVSSYTNENLNDYCVDDAVYSALGFNGNGSGMAGCPSNTQSGFFAARSAYGQFGGGPNHVGTLYRIRITVSNFCSSSTAFSYVEITQAFRKKDPLAIESEEVMEVYPNPANNNVTFEFDINEKSAINLSIFNVEGKLVKTVIQDEIYEIGHVSKQVDISDLEQGTYMYKNISNKSVKTGLLIKQ